MTETNYQMRKAEAREQLPEIDLLPQIHYEDKQLDIALFGPNTYKGNIQNMQKAYFHSKKFPNITFRPATTSESISAAENNFADFIRSITSDPRWLQAGYILRTQEGVFVNPLDAQRIPITDEKTLKSFLNADRKVNGIYLLDNDMGFAPYDSFVRGVQGCDTFAQGGLARVLEHTSEKEAKKFRAIASPKFYKKGVNVWGFDNVKEPILRVVSLISYRNFAGDNLKVYGGDSDGNNVGFAFGVFEDALAYEPKIKVAK
jgi:hypothetical protein